jgi:hypothetical protein
MLTSANGARQPFSAQAMTPLRRHVAGQQLFACAAIRSILVALHAERIELLPNVVQRAGEVAAVRVGREGRRKRVQVSQRRMGPLALIGKLAAKARPFAMAS